MGTVGNWVETKLSPPLLRLGNQRHVLALRGGLIRIIPLLIIGSIPLILANLPVESWANAMAPYEAALMTLFSMSFGFLSLYLSISVAAELARGYKLEVTSVSIISAACYLITVAPIDLETGTLSTQHFGATGMFAAFLVGIIVVEVMRFMRDRKLMIRMPAGVPDNISASFSSLIPLLVLFVFFWLLRVVLNFDLAEAISFIVSPLLILADTWYAVLVTSLLLTMLWFVGIHGGSLTVQGAMYAFLFSNIAANAAAHQAGMPLPHIFTEPFVFTYGMPSGVGITLPLILIWWRSRSVKLREISRVSLAPGIFNINEPINFGAPIILNPLMFLPFVFGTTTLGMMYGYIITKIGWVTAPFIQVPWTTPPLIQPYLATGGDWRAVVAQLILFVVVGLIWFPFAKIWEQRCIAEEQESA
ncbi:MAG: PTS sugar transporter subunit IIC [Firmicutes bacterium]|nr:PTS sugar transporter subunit IIC [Bacillota bacterium]